MIDRHEIQDLCFQIVREFRPQKVLLFGSHAGGAPNAGSDVDLLVIMPFEGSPIRKAGAISLRLTHRFPVDLLVRTPEHITQRLAMNDPFIREIMEKGEVLCDAAGVGVGQQG
jgi:uncharacterized protein